MKTTYANKPRSLHFTTSFGQLYSDCNPSTVVRGVKGRRTEEVVGWRAPAFTIVELLIVIVVIGILAAISIVAYMGISNSAYNATVQQDLRNTFQEFELYKTEFGNYPISNAQITAAGFQITQSAYGNHYQNIYNFLYCRNSDGSGEAALIARTKSGAVYAYSSTAGAARYPTATWSTGSYGVCPEFLGIDASTMNISYREYFYNAGAWKSIIH